MLDLTRALPTYVLLGLVGIATGGATLLGGALALRLKSHIRLILGFSAGAVVGVAMFDLLPEALALAGKARPTLDTFGFAVAGFSIYMVVDRFLQAATAGRRGSRGHFGAASLTVHSFLDGLGIGLAFMVSAPVGVVLALAVLAHDFSDGVNTVNLTLAGGGNLRAARLWLAADALAPMAGIIVAQKIVVDQSQLAGLLAGFAGVFLYIGASELLPESHHQHPHLWTSIATILGVLLIYAAVHFAGG